VAAELRARLKVHARLEDHRPLALRPHRALDCLDDLPVGQADPLDVLRREETNVDAPTGQSGRS
jgi:hypothetical protein